jgi:ATP:ADP antiporter, AAA family
MSIFSYKSYYIPAFVLAFIFCGAIVGETVSISLVVSALGTSVLSKLYLVNGILLYGLPLFFLGKIDRIDRGNFLSKQLLFISGILALILVSMTLVSYNNLAYKNILLILLYPFSYLSKTILFLTFWTLANDIYATSEAKKTFPIIAAWGMTGGLIGACTARLIVDAFATESVIIL